MNKTTSFVTLSKVLPLLIFTGLAAASADQGAVLEPVLKPVDRHEQIGNMVAEFIEQSHYSHATIDDELSSRVLDRYIEALDNNRMYFLASDIESFEAYRYRLDDIVRTEPLDPVFDMFEVYRTRVRERLEYALSPISVGRCVNAIVHVAAAESESRRGARSTGRKRARPC